MYLEKKFRPSQSALKSASGHKLAHVIQQGVQKFLIGGKCEVEQVPRLRGLPDPSTQADPSVKKAREYTRIRISAACLDAAVQIAQIRFRGRQNDGEFY